MASEVAGAGAAGVEAAGAGAAGAGAAGVETAGAGAAGAGAAGVEVAGLLSIFNPIQLFNSKC